MKKSFLLSWLAILFCFNAFGQWTTTNLSEGKTSMGSVAYGSKVYFGGGDNLTEDTKRVEIYDINTGEWAVEQFSIGREFSAVGAAGGKVLFAGGINFYTLEHFSRVDIFDTLTHVWTTAELPEQKFDVAAISYGDRIFFAGGVNIMTGNSSSVDIYNATTGEWTAASLSEPGEVRAVSVGSKLFFVGAGIMDIYDAATGTWSALSLPDIRPFAGVVTVGNKIIIAGGMNLDNTPSDRVDIYNLGTGGWTQANLSLPRAFINNAATVCGKAFFAGGGRFDLNFGYWLTATNVVDIYDSSTGEWTTDHVSHPIVNHSVISIEDHLLVAGGIDPADLTTLFSTVDIYTCPGTLLDAQFVHNDSMRSYKLYVPAAYDGSEPWPLVINLHGFTLNPDFMIALTGMNTVADTGHFLVAYPQGLLVHQLGDLIPPFPEIGPGWNGGGELVSGNDDVGFLSRMIHKIGLSHRVDPARVYACGLSNGGHMSYRLACELSDRIAAVVSVSGAMPTDVLCANGRPIPLMEIHGTADPIVSYNGLPPYHFSIPDGIAFWVNHNQCDAAPVVVNFPDTDPTDGTTVTLKKYGNCDADASVWQMDVLGGGHVWPTSYLPPPPFIGATNNDVHGSSQIWNFFKNHVHPDPVLTQFPWHADPVPNPFGIENPVAPPPQWPTIVRLADFDNDGVKEAMTVVGISTSGTTDMRYFENLGTDAAPVFQYVKSYPFGIPANVAPWQFVDIDGDCDLDIFHFTFALNFAPLRFLENKGTPEEPWFGDSQLTMNPFGFSPPVNASGNQLSGAFFQFVDIDDDNDYDLLYGGRFINGLDDENYYLYLNEDPSGNGAAPSFSTPLVNPCNLPKPAVDYWVFPSFLDMDCDGDWDFFSTNAGKGIDYFENIGTASAPDFGFEPVSSWLLPDAPPPGFLFYNFGDWIDIGGDGDMDLLYGGSQFYENITDGSMACLKLMPNCEQTAVKEGPDNTNPVTFPNPTDGIVKLALPGNLPAGCLLRISDAYGRIYQKETLGNEGASAITVDLSNLPPGMYLLHFGNEKSRLCSKVLKR